MQYLTVVYDDQCGLCKRLGGWLAAQPKWIGIRLLPSHAASRLFPTLADRIAHDELIVVSDDWMNRIHEYKGDEGVKEERMAWPAGRAHHLPRLREFLEFLNSSSTI
jgi:hypothetical protein